MKTKENKGKTKENLKRSLLVLAGIIGIYCTVNLLITLIFAWQIPHRFASAEEGREIMLANTEYYGHLTQNDLELRLGKTGATMEEFLEASKESVQEYSFFEKWYLNSRIARMALQCKLKGYHLPEMDEIVYIRADMGIESGASGYTHGTEIYLNGDEVKIYAILNFIPGFSDFLDKTLYHELFHCLTRCNPDFRKDMYSFIHFTVVDHEYELPPSVLEKYLSNPDVEHHNSYATFIIDGQPIDCFEAWITTKTFAESQGRLMSNDIGVLVPIDGTDIYYTIDQASNFDEVMGTNTTYRIDPEEYMADNFAYALLYGKKGPDGDGYPNPEIIQNIMDYMKK